MKLKPVYTYILITLSMIFWGGSFVLSKILLKYYDPITTVLLRLILSSLIMFGGLKLFNRLQKIKKGDYKLFLLSAFFNPFLYFLSENYGLKYSSPTVSSVIIGTIPLFTPIVGYIIFRERLTWLNIVGLLISFFGVIIMLIDKDFSLTASPVGVAWLFLAVITAVLYAVFLKKLAFKYDAFNIIAVQNFIGIFYFLPLFFILDFRHFITVRPNAEMLVSLLLLAFFASSLAFAFYTIGAREIGISKTNLFSNTIPVFTALFSFFVLKEVFEAEKIIGIALVLTGVLLSQIKGKRVLVNFYRFIFFGKKHDL
ncbi:MAG: DMT family transporter [Bacteroidales bacterium]|nr:DMT family transporter [Bacteroidales bacterium]MDI9593290.1 DMT family transporter [Bacteroidota bacterium]HOF80465.1 DMT family transporter [Bacteroidales bacterium]HOR75865.1 DMT family transporter [Bacteroidales bacterium]HPL11217.1 DMT family transporter [Bacteroidales bacterium]